MTMKIAILLTGNLRSWRICCHILKKSILDHYDCDIFMSVDLKNNIQNENKNLPNDTSLNELNDAINFYNPKKVYYATNYDFTDEYTKLKNIKTAKIYEKGTIDISFNNDVYAFSKSYDDTKINQIVPITFNNNYFKAIYAQYFNVLKCYELMSEYSKDNNINYDIVMRLRFDHFILDTNTINIRSLFQTTDEQILYNDHNIEIAKHIDNIKIHLSYPADNSIYVIGAGSFCGYAYVNDWFWITNRNTASVVWVFYEHLINIVKESCETYYPFYGAAIEHFFYKHLVKNNIMIKQSCITGQVTRTLLKTN